jgi:hypothetical protein
MEDQVVLEYLLQMQLLLVCLNLLVLQTAGKNHLRQLHSIQLSINSSNKKSNNNSISVWANSNGAVTKITLVDKFLKDKLCALKRTTHLLQNLNRKGLGSKIFHWLPSNNKILPPEMGNNISQGSLTMSLLKILISKHLLTNNSKESSRKRRQQTI